MAEFTLNFDLTLPIETINAIVRYAHAHNCTHTEVVTKIVIDYLKFVAIFVNEKESELKNIKEV